MQPTLTFVLAALLLAPLDALHAAGAPTADDLDQSFGAPPPSTRPWVLWYWMNGRIDREGIIRDLEAMARQGIGGVVLGDIAQREERDAVKFLTPEWQELFAHALQEAKRLGLTVSTCPSAGWCATGGQWIEPEDSMQVLVWSTTRISGPRRFNGTLPQPQMIEGHYRDVAVIAVPADSEPLVSLKEISAIGTKEKPRQLVDGNPGTVVRFQGGAHDPRPMVEFQFHMPVMVCGVTLEFADVPRLKTGKVQAAARGGDWADIGRFRVRAMKAHGKIYRVEAGVRATLTDRLRLLFDEGGGAFSGAVTEIEIFGKTYVPGWTAKSGAEVDARETAEGARDSAAQAVDAGSVAFLSERLSPEGRLDWEVPVGDWVILRFGHTSRGAMNRPAVTGEGLESDKFRKDITKLHFDRYIGLLAEKNRDCASVLNAMWVDSWETGYQNWSPVFVDEFKRRRGYDPLSFLPAMTGRAVGSGRQTDRFLWDIRRTIADLGADNFIGALTEFGKPYGIGLWFQPINRHFLDGLQGVGRGTGAEANMHFNSRNMPKREYPREKFCASAAHGYGQVVVHSEAATAFPPSGGFVETPASLRELVNANFVTGMNNHWIHVFLHQPWPRATPGLSWMWGLQFQRNNTWWEKLRGWSSYVTRCQYLLRQGVPVVDIACFLGETVPAEAGLMGGVEELHRLPVGIDYDLCNAEILLTRMSAKDGRIVLPDGMSYALLYIPPSVKAVRPDVLAKIRDLVRDGVTLVGNPPAASPSLQNYPACDREVAKLAGELWGTDGKPSATGRCVGLGRVYSNTALARALADLVVVEDFSFTAAQSGAWIESYHRRTAEAEIYFVANRKDRAEEAFCTFRVKGKAPELWYPDTGRIAAPLNWTRDNERTSLALSLEPHDALFVVFRQAGDPPAARTVLRESPVAEINGPWAVTFQKDRGAPDRIDFPSLISWHEHQEAGIRYFSGTATYRNKFALPGDTDRGGGRLFLDLGDVREVAEVWLNGKNLGILWKKPFRADITGLAKAGDNDLAIEVVNLWVNRMIGDEVMYPDDAAYAPLAAGDWKGFQLRGGLPDWFDAWSRGKGPRPTGRVTFSTVKFFSAKDPLLPSGLIGSVRIIRAEEQRVRNNP